MSEVVHSSKSFTRRSGHTIVADCVTVGATARDVRRGVFAGYACATLTANELMPILSGDQN